MFEYWCRTEQVAERFTPRTARIGYATGDAGYFKLWSAGAGFPLFETWAGRGCKSGSRAAALHIKTRCKEMGRNAVEVVLAGKSACVVRLAKSDVNWLVSRKLPIEW